MLDKLGILEDLIRQQMQTAPNRGHNNPPSLLEIEPPASQKQLLELASAIDEIRRESTKASPDRRNIEANLSVLRRAAKTKLTGLGWIAAAGLAGVIGNEATLVFEKLKPSLYDAVGHAIEGVGAWLESLPSF
ncbi:hypothetical protein [Nitratireductor sp. GZWM139]|uniref:hypothetical protein n=1 Tax=Nitratireductor sp. GZWM139 TaxID=2950541 RepID=UPI0024BE1726|nr:hypothetical protein [Nitratireductor sp. GZWM139]MDJ1462368.1 hypothetical protein [Nitratireductor sp. GZWM139]